MGKTSSASKNKYNAKAYDRIGLMLPKGYRDMLKGVVNGGSVNAYIKDAIDEKLKKEGQA